MRCRRYLVRGRVHGVGYRYFTFEAASRHGIRGFARNLSDGRVEVVAEGEDNRLARFLDELREGPPAARVEALEETELPAGSIDGERFEAFTIRETR
jgi:acylphosphatase